MTTSATLPAGGGLPPRKEPKVDLDATRERLGRLGLVHAAELVAEHVAQAVKDSAPPHRLRDVNYYCR